MELLIASPIGGLLYRLRGGVLKDWLPSIFGTQASRAVWAIPTGAFLWHVSGGPLWLFPVLSVSCFLSMVLVGTGQYLQDVPARWAPDWLGMTRTLIAAAPLEPINLSLCIAYTVSGIVHAQLYWLGFRLRGNSQAGEFLVGSFSWAIIAMFWS